MGLSNALARGRIWSGADLERFVTLAATRRCCILAGPMRRTTSSGLAAAFALVACNPTDAALPIGTTSDAASTSAPDTTPPASTSGDASTSSADATTLATADMSGGTGSTDDTTTGDVEEMPRWQQIIAAEPYSRLVIEVDYVPGREPRQSSIDELEAILESVLDKPGGVQVVLDEELATQGPDHAWTIDERVQLAIATSNLQVDDDTIKIHTLSLDGRAIEDDSMDGVLLGVAWGFENIVLWRDTLDGGCMGVGMLVDELCAQAELLIWQHEVGHVVGLVDGGLPMVDNHLDPTPGAGKHDVDHACVMFREYEGLDAIDATLDRVLMGGPAIELDAACLADIEAAK
jgi:hypothetical protein